MKVKVIVKQKPSQEVLVKAVKNSLARLRNRLESEISINEFKSNTNENN